MRRFSICFSPPPTASTTILDNLDEPPGTLPTSDRLFFAYKRSAEEPSSSIELSLFPLNLLEYVTIGHSLHGLWASIPKGIMYRKKENSVGRLLVLLYHSLKVAAYWKYTKSMKSTPEPLNIL